MRGVWPRQHHFSALGDVLRLKNDPLGCSFRRFSSTLCEVLRAGAKVLRAHYLLCFDHISLLVFPESLAVDMSVAPSIYGVGGATPFFGSFWSRGVCFSASLRARRSVKGPRGSPRCLCKSTRNASWGPLRGPWGVSGCRNAHRGPREGAI